jgi:uncharacterized protein involved in outer membrane biogenesis
VFGLLVVLLVVVYFVATSGAFFKGVILPRVSKAINAEVTVSDAAISPFKQVVLRNLKVQTTGTEPLVTAAEVRLRYSLMDIIGGNLHVDEVGLSSPTVTLVENADGSSNLDPLLKAQSAKPAETKPVPPAKPPGAKPLQIDLKKFALTDATLRRVKNYANGTRDLMELSHVNVTLDDLKNGQTGKLALNADLHVEDTNGVLQAKLDGSFALALTADLQPASIKGSTRLDVTRAEGALADLAALCSELDVEITPTDIKGVTLLLHKGDTRLGELRVSGPFDPAKTEGRLTIELTGIDQRLLNLAGAKSGMDFGGTTISSTNEVELAQGGSVITASGRFDVSKFQLTRANQTTPRLDLRKDYNLTVDRAQSVATLRSLTVTATQNGNPLLKAELTSPMQIAWGNVSNALGDSALTLTVSHLNLADWKPFVGDSAPAGIVNANAKVLSQQGGQQVTFDFDSRIDHLTVNAGSNQISDAAITLQASGHAANLNQFNLTSSKLEVARQNQTLTSVSASGTYDKASDTADLQVAIRAVLAPLLQALPQPDMSVSSGTLDLKARVTQKQKAQAVTGSLALEDFTGRFGQNEVRGFGTAADFDVAMTSPQVADIRQFQLTLTPTARATNQVQLSGRVDMSQTNAIQGDLKLVADSLDVTALYDLFMGGKKASGAGGATAPATATAPADANKEPEAIKLPFHNFTVEAAIRRFYLREVEIADWQTTVKIDGGHAVVDPFKLTLNGAPVNTTVDLDLGVPGWKYDLSLSAQAIPLAPLVNSFQPERKGMLSGTLTAQAKLGGAGTTGASLQKNLSGQFDLATTNLNLSVDNIQGNTAGTRLLKTLVTAIGAIPDLAKNPASAATSLLGLGGSSGGGGTTDLKKSPINSISLRGAAGSGRVDLQNAVVESPTFEAQAQGTITLAAVLTNSPLQIPVSVFLERSVAQRLNMAGNTPANATYAKLPDFLTMKGTLGNSKADINKVALVSAVLQGVGGKGGQASSLLQGVGGLLGNNAPGATNAPATNPSPKSLLKGFLGR